MSPSKRMIKHRFRGLSKSFGSQIDPEKSEELKRTKTDIENNLTRIQKLIKNEEQSKKEGNSRKEKELVGLIEDFYNQYQSLYALYGRLTGEYTKASPHRVESVPSVSSSSSESEYFSSDEIDGNTDITNDSNQKPFSRERERSTLANITTHEVLLKTQTSNEEKELESLNQQKKNLELHLEHQARQVKQLGANNTELQNRVLELELLLKESKGTVSTFKEKLKNNEDQETSNTSELMAQINKLKQEAKSLQIHKGKMDEKIKSNRNEALNQKKELEQKLDSVNNQNKELEAQIEKEREEVSQCLVRIENLKENLAERTSVEKRMVKEKECFLARIKDLELEVESRCSKQNDLEEQLRDTRSEIDRVTDQGKALQNRNHELERALRQREEEISSILREHENSKNESTIQTMALTSEIDNLRAELDTLQDQKCNLELHNERSKEEYSESLMKIENLNSTLETRVADQEETIKKLTQTIEQIGAENKQAKIWSKKFETLTEKKMEELAEEFRKKMEDNVRLLRRRIHVAEQLNNENRDNYKMTKQRYEQESKMLEEKIASYENELRKPSKIEVNLNELELGVINGLDLAAGKLEEQREQVSKMMGEVRFVKAWIREINGETKLLKEKVDNLTVLLGEKEEQEFLLRERVWKLEANVSREGGEKLNLMKAVSKLERKVWKLEKNLKEKEEELVGLGEKKREAIRQLCFLVEFHRDRWVYLKDLMLKRERKVSNRK